MLIKAFHLFKTFLALEVVITQPPEAANEPNFNSPLKRG